MAQNKDLVADAQTLQKENPSEKKSESARRLVHWNNVGLCQSRGTVPVLHNFLNISVNIWGILFASCFKILGLISTGPAAL